MIIEQLAQDDLVLVLSFRESSLRLRSFVESWSKERHHSVLSSSEYALRSKQIGHFRDRVMVRVVLKGFEECLEGNNTRNLYCRYATDSHR